MEPMKRTIRHYLPGILVLVAGAAVATAGAAYLGLNAYLLAIVIGVLLTNSLRMPEAVLPGIRTHKLWLALGIILLGSSVTLGAILDIGPAVLLLLLATVSLALISGEVLASRIDDISETFGSLLASGASICGVSAVVAVGGAIKAKESRIAYAAGAVLLVDALSIVGYPLIGSALNLSDVAFGIWAGVSMLSTGPVVAVGFAYSETSGQWATIVKLARNALIGFVALGYASYYARRRSGESASIHHLWSNIPSFLIGFLFLLVLASAGFFSETQLALMDTAVYWLFLIAFVGLGTELQRSVLADVGIVPALVILGAMVIASVFSLTVILLLL